LTKFVVFSCRPFGTTVVKERSTTKKYDALSKFLIRRSGDSFKSPSLTWR